MAHSKKGRIGVRFLKQIVEKLRSGNLLLQKRTISASKLIEVPFSAKNKKKEGDQEPLQTKKGNQLHLGHKEYIGVDVESKLVCKAEPMWSMFTTATCPHC